ncbi:ferrous iron transport protein A [Evansella caseinilytica]|uniref:Ferrous iron transport protein A n=1 Tax=Evansella caseinilytica TaxID=1503961 RepID=A0A1H3TPB6_9BACI|nr:FeoA family protein [Evansella caseinilytica]SDZ51960.1 ferrous iron transport protein A [Evansella caseinilytica]
MQLSELSVGERAKIVDISGCQLLIQKRLNHMGIFENCEVLLQNMLPFGGPCMISCGEQCISIRKKEAKTIVVEKLPCK